MSDINEQKEKIRQRFKGVDPDSLEVIPAEETPDIFDPDIPQRVAVYARVSTGDPRQTSSIEMQKNYYEDLIKRNPNWTLVDIYADEGISGTSLKHRDAFLRMIDDCQQGKIDLIITKSISRFSRNIIDCISYVRLLNALPSPVAVWFETERIFTFDDKMEMSLSFLATLAQEESHNKSQSMNLSIEMRFKHGIFLTPKLLGYDKDENGNLVINEEEANTVRFIFYMYLYGKTPQEIANMLMEYGRLTKIGNEKWTSNTVLAILQNERHCGDVRARKTYTPNYLDHKSKKNNRKRNQYIGYDHHPPIISRDDFIAVQQMIRNFKYGSRGFLPELRVIAEGILKEYVLINPTWASFKEEDYYAASGSLPDTPEDTAAEKKDAPKDGEFDLRGYEIARSQFFSMKAKIYVSMTTEAILFSSVAVRKMPQTMYVELLVHPGKHLFAVRPGQKEAHYSVRWSKNKNDVLIAKPIPAAAFMPVLFKVFGWDPDNRYVTTGKYIEKDGQGVLFFDLSEAEAYIPVHKPANDKKKSVIHGYPQDWAEAFGDGYYEQNDIANGSEWNAAAKGIPYKTSNVEATSPEEAEKTANQLASEFMAKAQESPQKHEEENPSNQSSLPDIHIGVIPAEDSDIKGGAPGYII